DHRQWYPRLRSTVHAAQSSVNRVRRLRRFAGLRLRRSSEFVAATCVAKSSAHPSKHASRSTIHDCKGEAGAHPCVQDLADCREVLEPPTSTISLVAVDRRQASS